MADTLGIVTNQRPFTMAYNDFLRCGDLTPTEKILYLVLKSHAGEKIVCFPAIGTLAKECNVSRRQISYTLKSLVDKDFIIKHNRRAKNGALQTSEYYIRDMPPVGQDGQESTATGLLLDIMGALISSQQENLADKLQKALLLLEQKKAPAASAITTGKDPLKNHIKDCISNIHDADANCQDAISKYNDADANGEQMAAQSGATKAKHQDAGAQSGAADVNCHIAEAQSGAQDRPGKSRATEYTMAYLRDKYDYHILRADTDINKTQLDYTLQIIYDTLNSTGETIKVQGEAKPASVVKSQLLGLNYAQIKYVIEKYNQQTSRITNTRGYILSMLYVAKGQQQADVSNRVRADGVI